MKKIAFATLLSIAAGFASAAQAQVALENGATMTTGASLSAPAETTAIDLGDYSQSTSWRLVSQMPMSLSYADVNVGISFTGTSALYDGGTQAPSSQNYLLAATGGTVTLQFSQAQTYFQTNWGSPDGGNAMDFYNGDQLVASVSGRQVPGVSTSQVSTVAFNFSELGYDRVVASTSFGSLEFGDLRFAGPAPAVAPIPLNAASMGGLMSFLMMLGMWGKGGTRRMLHMAFASITPRRRAAGLA